MVTSWCSIIFTSTYTYSFKNSKKKFHCHEKKKLFEVEENLVGGNINDLDAFSKVYEFAEFLLKCKPMNFIHYRV